MRDSPFFAATGRYQNTEQVYRCHGGHKDLTTDFIFQVALTCIRDIMGLC